MKSIGRTRYRGGCHCGRISFECEGILESVSICNCSICAKQAYMHWLVPRADFRLLTPLKNLSTYTFTDGTARHHFCANCGTAPFAMPRAHPGSVDINVRCIEGIDLGEIRIDYADSKLRQAAHTRSGRSARAGVNA
jgi:hypothetical protein